MEHTPQHQYEILWSFGGDQSIRQKPLKRRLTNQAEVPAFLRNTFRFLEGHQIIAFRKVALRELVEVSDDLYPPTTYGRLAYLLTGIPTKDLYALISRCDDAERRGFPWSAIFYKEIRPEQKP